MKVDARKGTCRDFDVSTVLPLYADLLLEVSGRRIGGRRVAG
jgi:hypothetical protein